VIGPEQLIRSAAGAAESSLRILTFTSLYPNAEQPLHGLFVRARVRALSKLSELTVVAPVPWSPPTSLLGSRYMRYRRILHQEDHDGLRVHHPRFLVVPKVLKSTDGVLMGLSSLAPVRRLHQNAPFQLIDAHWAYPDGVAAVIVGQSLGVPVSITVRGDDINVFALERGRGLSIRWALRRAALIVAVSEDLKRRVDAITQGSVRSVVIPNGIDGDLFKPLDPRAARAELGIGSSGRIIVSVGRLHQSKGFPVVVDALGQLGAAFGDVRLYIVGEPDYEADARPEIAAAIERHGLRSRVVLTGSEPPDRLAKWYAAADLFCSATSREGSPNVVREAMACGLPCITTPFGGNVEAVTSAELGMLVPPEANVLAAALRQALTKPWDRARIAADARQRTWSDVAAECRRQFVSIVAHK
jgi:glycosyltransferase involved in cell wall biosynthesis